MSQNTNEQLDQAYSMVFDQVHARAFLHKMASRGYNAETQQDQMELLQLGDKLAELAETFDAQAQQQGHGKYASAIASLNQITQPNTVSEAIVKQAAQELAEQEEIRDAVLLLASQNL